MTLRDAIQAAGLTPPEDIVADGVIHRFPSNGHHGDDAGWYVAFDDGIQAGAFGDWRTGISETWSATPDRDLDPAQLREQRSRIQRARQQADAERKERQADAAQRAAEIWEAAGLAIDHPYLTAKGIEPHGVRVHDGRLVIPMRDGGQIHSLQYIDGDGGKRFFPGGRVSGCYYSIGKPEGIVCIAEGFATAVSVHEASGYAVAVAFSAGNLEMVARTLRNKFPDIRIVVCADNDESGVGQEKAREAAEAVGALVAIPPEVGDDFNDMHRRHGYDAVRECIEQASAGEQGDTSQSMEEIVEALAALPVLDLTKSKLKTAAKRLDVSTTDLKKAIEKCRRAHGGEDDAKGQEIKFKEFVPWPERVKGADVLSEVAEAVRRRAVLPDWTADTIALWVVHTHIFEELAHSPRLLITAPEAECGKTRLMSHVVGALVPRPMPVELMKPAPFFRLAEEFKPVFLIDEVDVFIREDSDLVAALNTGFEPHGMVPRCVGEKLEVRAFRPYCPVAMAGIALQKKLQAATISRCLVIHLDRGLPDELRNLTRIKRDDPDLERLGRQIAAWVESRRGEFGKPPASLAETGRSADKWGPLFRIAEMAGGEWPERCRNAFTAINQQDKPLPTTGSQLLEDIRQVFQDRDKIWTADLIERLAQNPERPWREYNYHSNEKQIKDKQIATLLKPYQIKPKDLRIGDEVKRGYERKQFDRAFSQYLGSPSATPLQPSAGAAFSDFPSATSEPPVVDEYGGKSSIHAGCSTVARSTPFPGGNADQTDNSEFI